MRRGTRWLGLAALALGLVSCGRPLIYVIDPPTQTFLDAAGLPKDLLASEAQSLGYNLEYRSTAADQVLSLLRNSRAEGQKFLVVAPSYTVADAELAGFGVFPPRLALNGPPVAGFSPAGFDQLARVLAAKIQAHEAQVVNLLATPNQPLSLAIADRLRTACQALQVPIARIEVTSFELGQLRGPLGQARNPNQILVLAGPVTDPGVWIELAAPEYRFVAWNAGPNAAFLDNCLGSLGFDYRALWRETIVNLQKGQELQPAADWPTKFESYK